MNSTLRDEEFRAFQRLIHQEAGIWLSPAKKALLTSRLAGRLRELHLDSFGAYFRHVTQVDPSEQVRMLDCITTNETRFFREPRQFEFLGAGGPPGLSCGGRGRPAPTPDPRLECRLLHGRGALFPGHEPARPLPAVRGLGGRGRGHRPLHPCARRAPKDAVWPLEDAREIPARYLKRFMLRGVRAHEGSMKAGPELRSVVRFQRMNLNHDHYPVAGPFDLVFCRNVLIYFEAAGKERVLARLRDQLAPRDTSSSAMPRA